MNSFSLRKICLASVMALGFSAAISSAAISFTEDFSSGAIGGDFVVTSGTGNAPDFSTFAAVFDDGGNSGRSYIGTAISDYAGMSFTAEVTVTIPDVNEGASIAFFGLGPGIEGTVFSGGGGGSVNAFNEPSFGPVVYALHDPNGTVEVADRGASNVSGNGGTNAGSLGPGIHRLRMVYDVTAGTLTFSADDNNDGSGFDAYSFTATSSDNGFDTSNARIFFGGANNVTFDDFAVTVVPEPSVAMFLSGVVVCLVMRRQRRRAG